MTPLFERLKWRDPATGKRLEPTVSARTPSGAPLSGLLGVEGTAHAYAIVDAVARLTPALAQRYARWIEAAGATPPPAGKDFQAEESVDSFGFQWGWNSAMRSNSDLMWRVATRFKMTPEDFRGKVVLDAGAGAGDQSRWLLDQGASVVSLDLSAAIEVVARKLRERDNWCGIQGDLLNLPLEPEQFDIVYCEGVIQHTANSPQAVSELLRVLKPGGRILATHYGVPVRLLGRMKLRYVNFLRSRLSRMERFKLLLATGLFAGAAYIPGLRALMRKSGTATYYDLMPDFKSTWTNTFDTFGNHAYQRHITPDEFWSYFAAAGGVEKIYQEHTLIAARKV